MAIVDVKHTQTIEEAFNQVAEGGSGDGGSDSPFVVYVSWDCAYGDTIIPKLFKSKPTLTVGNPAYDLEDETRVVAYSFTSSGEELTWDEFYGAYNDHKLIYFVEDYIRVKEDYSTDPVAYSPEEYCENYGLPIGGHRIVYGTIDEPSHTHMFILGRMDFNPRDYSGMTTYMPFYAYIENGICSGYGFSGTFTG